MTTAGNKIAVGTERQILVALKRNDEYALNIKVLRRVTQFTHAETAL
jgi:hypothetical protein